MSQLQTQCRPATYRDLHHQAGGDANRPLGTVPCNSTPSHRNCTAMSPPNLRCMRRKATTHWHQYGTHTHRGGWRPHLRKQTQAITRQVNSAQPPAPATTMPPAVPSHIAMSQPPAVMKTSKDSLFSSTNTVHEFKTMISPWSSAKEP